MAAKWNLINNDKASGNYNIQQQQQHQPPHEDEDDVLDGADFINNYHSEHEQTPPHRSICTPTDQDENGPQFSAFSPTYHNIHELHQHNSSPTRHRPQLSASLPIEVPTRRTRRDTSSMKLSLMLMEDELESEGAPFGVVAGGDPSERSLSSASSTSNSDVDDAEDEELSPVRKGDRNRPAFASLPAFDDDLDDDSFLDQEFNENHHNHYSVNDLDDENLSAEEDPMRLFASIQALAKSLHDDSELFGSLPPKRLLESPIRSIALV